MRTAGALKLNEQLQPVGAQMGHLRGEQREEAAHPCVHVKHPRVLEGIDVLRTEDFCQALDIPDVRTVIERQTRTIYDPDPLALDLIKVRLETGEIRIRADFRQEGGGCIVQGDVPLYYTDELKNGLHYSGRRRMPEILSAISKGCDGVGISTGALADVDGNTGA